MRPHSQNSGLTDCIRFTNLSSIVAFYTATDADYGVWSRRTAGHPEVVMRSAFLFPLSLSLVVVGCGSQVKEHAARSDLERDLTLVGQAPQTAIATPIELGRIRTPTGSGGTVSSRHRIRHRAATRATVRAPKPVDVVAGAPRFHPTNTTPADPRELAPGKTVSIIPASSGISDAEGVDGFPAPRPGPRPGTGGSGMGGGDRAGGGSGIGGDCPRPDLGPAVGIRGGTRGLLY